MNTKSSLRSLFGGVAAGALLMAVPAAHAQTSAADFKSEPDKSMAAAHESFVKGDTKKASEQIHKAADFVKRQSNDLAADSKEGARKTGEELDKLGDSVKNGTVKTGDELKKGFAKADLQMSKCWHATAAEAKKSGQDSSAALKKAGDGLDGAAKWSGNQLSEGAKASVDAVKKAGHSTASGVKSAADDTDKWFKGIGDGISELGHKLNF